MARSSSQGRLVTFRNDRLGGRLMALVNAMRVAADHDFPFAVQWHEATDVGRVFNDPKLFFRSDWVDAHFITKAEFDSRRDKTLRFDSLGDTSAEALRDLMADGYDIHFVQPFGYALVGDETEAQVAKRCSEIWADFPFAESLADDLAAVSDQLKGATAYHIRRGDIITEGRPMNRAWPGKYTPAQYFDRHMRRIIGEGARPVVFSDHAGTVEGFAKRFPELIPIDSLLASDHLTEGQRDLMELFAMSRCARIIAPASSAFSSTATTLGGCPKLDVTEDLSPEDIAGAKQDLVEFMTQAAASGEITSPGDLGQLCQHLADHLSATGEQAKAAQILRDLIENGLNLSFVYPLAMQLMLDAGDHEGVIALGRHLSERMLYHRRDVADALSLVSLAQIEAGRAAEAGTTAFRAYWHGPDTPLVRQLVGTYFATGALAGSPFPPASPALLALRNRSAPILDQFDGFAPIRARLDAVSTKSNLIPGVAAVEWDWGPLMRAFNPARLKDDNQREKIERSLEVMERKDPNADNRSLTALYDAYMGKRDKALRRFDDLTEDHPDEAVVWHRLSLVHWYDRDFALAEAAADRAATLDPASPARIGWRGLIRYRTRRFEGAIEDLNTAISSGVQVPAFYLTLADIHARLKDRDKAIDTLAGGVAFSPREQECRFMRARLNFNAGHPERGLEDLDALLSIDTRSPKVLTLQAECLAASGKPQAADDFLSAAMDGAVDATKLKAKRAELREKHGAKGKKQKKSAG